MTTSTISSIKPTNSLPSGVIKPSPKGVTQSMLMFIPVGLGFSIFTCYELIKPASPTAQPTFIILLLLLSTIPFFACGWEFINLISTRYEIQPSEIHITRSVLATFSQTIDAAKINSVQMQQNLLNRLLGIGNVIITTSSGERITLESLPNPYEVAEMIRQMKAS